MSEYGQKIRVFAIGCPSFTPVAQKLLTKLNKVAGKYDILEKQRDSLLLALINFNKAYQDSLTDGKGCTCLRCTDASQKADQVINTIN